MAVPEGCYSNVKGLNHAMLTGVAVAENVLAMINGTPLKTFAWSNKPIQTPMMTALGPNVAIGSLGLPSFLANLENYKGRSFKCKDFYMSIQGGNYGKGKTW